MNDSVNTEYTDKIVLVSGAGSGIGEAIAKAFSAARAKVYVADINLQAAEAVANELGEGAYAVSLDVRQPSDWDAVLDTIDQAHGKLDVLVNNAGVSKVGEFEQIELDDWQRTMDINSTGVFLGCKHSLRLLRKSEVSSIINMASVHSDKVHVQAIDYSASKAAVKSLTESVALYCAEKGYAVRCNAIKPGIILTPMLEAALDDAPDSEALLAAFNEKHPMGHIGAVHDVANVALFLASEKSAYITGTSIAVDGGFLAL